MTKAYNDWNTLLAEAFNTLHVGASRPATYPPYNVIKTAEGNFVVELAVAGFTPEDLSVEINDGALVVSGQVTQHEDADELSVEPNYIYKGIGMRSFTRKFTLHEYMEVVNTNLKNGILSIHIDMVIPENKKPRKVEINVQ